MSNHKYYIFYKPYDVLSQFTKEVPSHSTLKDYIDLPSDIYPVGRLDRDSEGLLLLTNDGKFKAQLLSPHSNSSKTYLVQVDGDINADAIKRLSNSVTIKIKKASYKTQPCIVEKITPPNIEDRNPPVRTRKTIPTSWIKITITEGKNRQIRKMCAAVGFPCLRLVRIAIKKLKFSDVQEGEFRLLTSQEIKQLKS